MIQSVTHAADGNTLTLSLHGELRTYSNDRSGRRQAILDGLNAIEPITVGEDVYLPGSDCLQVVAAVLYPDGIESEAAYQTVCQVTEKACGHIGFGDEVTLEPPAVPFSRRGSYRRRVPPVDAELVRIELNLAGTSSSFPRQELGCAILWNRMALALHDRRWNQLTTAEQQQIETQVDAIAAAAGWEKETAAATAHYQRPLPVNEAAARSRLDEMLRRENGRPVSVSSVIYQAQLGAYGRGFYSNELSPALQTIVTDTLHARGYDPAPVAGEYRPQAVALTPAAAADIAAAVTAVTPAMTEFGAALLLDDLLGTLVGEQPVSGWQAEQLLQETGICRALRQLGYQTELSWCQPYQFRPRRETGAATAVVLRAVRVTQDPERRLALAQGLAVLTPAVVIDDIEDTIVYLQMVGAKQAVRANWAALVGGSRVNWIGRQRVYLDGMKAHLKFQAALPCGWHDQILLHRQASLQTMNPEQPFYLLDDGTQPIPPLFYPMLNKCLALPLLPAWVAYLWENGREQTLITPLDEGQGQGYAAWRVLPAPEAWQAVVETGLQNRLLHF